MEQYEKARYLVSKTKRSNYGSENNLSLQTDDNFDTCSEHSEISMNTDNKVFNGAFNSKKNKDFSKEKENASVNSKKRTKSVNLLKERNQKAFKDLSSEEYYTNLEKSKEKTKKSSYNQDNDINRKHKIKEIYEKRKKPELKELKELDDFSYNKYEKVNKENSGFSNKFPQVNSPFSFRNTPKDLLNKDSDNFFANNIFKNDNSDSFNLSGSFGKASNTKTAAEIINKKINNTEKIVDSVQSIVNSKNITKEPEKKRYLNSSEFVCCLSKIENGIAYMVSEKEDIIFNIPSFFLPKHAVLGNNYEFTIGETMKMQYKLNSIQKIQKSIVTSSKENT